MRKSVFLIPLALAAMLPASAAIAQHADGEAALQKVLQGRVAGTPVSCLSLQTLGSSQNIDGTAIVYRTSGSRFYVNRSRGDASSIDSDDILLTRTVGSQLCRGDVVDLLDRYSRTPKGFVILGDFVPYDRAPRAK